jgi:hypothetical protein
VCSNAGDREARDTAFVGFFAPLEELREEHIEVVIVPGGARLENRP